MGILGIISVTSTARIGAHQATNMRSFLIQSQKLNITEHVTFSRASNTIEYSMRNGQSFRRFSDIMRRVCAHYLAAPCWCVARTPVQTGDQLYMACEFFSM